MTNLTQNAIKYSEEGSGIEMRLKRKEDQLIIEIEDHGKGIRKRISP